MLLLTSKKAATVPKLVISLGRRYVPYINRQYGCTGTLWESRYQSSLIQAATYLLTHMRYIEMNPVCAALVDDPAHYRWTRYRANDLGQLSPLLSPFPVYLALGAADHARRSVPPFVPAPSRSEDHQRPTACAEPKPAFGQNERFLRQD
ncbi:MAG: transposase [Gammaproteobacteria bacterium]